MLGQIIELQSLDMREGLGRLQTRNIRNGRMRPDVKENLISRQHARPVVVESHFDGFRRHKTAAAHDQFGAACLVVLQVLRNLTLHHRALALAYDRHIDGDGTGHGPVLHAVARRMRDFRARNFVLAWHASDIGTGAADPPPLHDRGLVSRLRHVPRNKLATGPTPENENVKTLRLRHALSPCECLGGSVRGIYRNEHGHAFAAVTNSNKCCGLLQVSPTSPSSWRWPARSHSANLPGRNGPPRPLPRSALASCGRT